MNNASNDTFSKFKEIFKSYDNTRLYRELKLKGFIIQNKELITFSEEEPYVKSNNCINVVNDQPITGKIYLINKGVFVATNIRIAWYSTSLDNYNLSLPWIHIRNMKTKESKHGLLVVMETDKYSGQQTFAFKFQENAEDILKPLKMWQQKFYENPIYSEKIDLTQSIVSENIEEKIIENNENIDTFNKLLSKKQDDDEFIEQNYFNEQSSMNYYKTTNSPKRKKNMQDIVFNTDLGK